MQPVSLNLYVVLSDADGDRRIAGIVDTTGGLLRSGALLFSPGTIAPENGKFRLTLRSATGGFARAPRVRCVGFNAIPMEQMQQIQSPAVGMATPNQQYMLARDGFMFLEAAPAIFRLPPRRAGSPSPGRSPPICRTRAPTIAIFSSIHRLAS